MNLYTRLQAASKVAGIHLFCSILVASLAAFLVFFLWYPYPYGELAGGKALFFIVVAVDVICGPLLTLVLFNPLKQRKELFRDLSIVAVIQLAALGYGIFAVWQARPLFLVLEIDRFKVVAAPDVDDGLLSKLPDTMRPGWLSKPMLVGLREPKDDKERNSVTVESVVGGRDYAERPDFYIPYSNILALQSLKRAQPLPVFLTKWPSQQAIAQQLAAEKGAELTQWMYLPVMGRQDWVAILDKQGQIQGFLKGDGF